MTKTENAKEGSFIGNWISSWKNSANLRKEEKLK